MTGRADVPLQVRVLFAHAALQAIADERGVDLLHVKGPALDTDLRPLPEPGSDAPTRRFSSDADVLVRPRQVEAFLEGLRAHGWRPITRFETGSAFHHAATWWHDELGYADVHRWFPGVGADPEVAFDAWWQARRTVQLAHRPAAVPNSTGQRLILLLHAARAGGNGSVDARVAWVDATPEQRAAVAALARELGADVALAAATGRLAEFAGSPEYELWRLHSSGQPFTRLEEWRARVKAAPTRRARWAIALRAWAVNTDHLARELGRPPSRWDVARAAVVRVGRALGDLSGLVRTRLRGPR